MDTRKKYGSDNYRIALDLIRLLFHLEILTLRSHWGKGYFYPSDIESFLKRMNVEE
jgi:hypothetical protein